MMTIGWRLREFVDAPEMRVGDKSTSRLGWGVYGFSALGIPCAACQHPLKRLSESKVYYLCSKAMEDKQLPAYISDVDGRYHEHFAVCDACYEDEGARALVSLRATLRDVGNVDQA